MRARSNTRSQSAMEYLMTYGWAILIIAVVLGVLFQLGVFSGSSLASKAQPGGCQVERFAGQVSLEGECQGQLPQFVGYFNGNSYISIGSPALLTQLTSATITAWINPSVIPSGCSDAVGEYASSSNIIMLRPMGSCRPGATHDDALVFIGGTTYQSALSSTLGTGSWYFTAYTYNGAYVVNYLNSTASTPGAGGGPMTLSGGTTYIGIVEPGADFSGDIADVQIYNASLSASEIKAIYMEGIGGAPVNLQSLVGWWPLNGNTNDYSGYNNNGQVHGAVVFNSSWQTGYNPP